MQACWLERSPRIAAYSRSHQPDRRFKGVLLNTGLETVIAKRRYITPDRLDPRACNGSGSNCAMHLIGQWSYEWVFFGVYICSAACMPVALVT